MPAVPTLFHRRSCSSRHLLGVVSTLTRLPGHRRTRLTFGLHFPYRRLILCVATDARAPTIGGIGSLHYLFEEYAFVFSDDTLPVADQVVEQVEYLWRDGDDVRPAMQRAPGSVECVLLEEIVQAANPSDGRGSSIGCNTKNKPSVRKM